MLASPGTRHDPDSRAPGPYPGHEKFNWHTVTRIFLVEKPFDEFVEGLTPESQAICVLITWFNRELGDKRFRCVSGSLLAGFELHQLGTTQNWPQSEPKSRRPCALPSDNHKAVELCLPKCRNRDRSILPRSMLDTRSPFRLLVTLLLAVAVPFCCCNFHSWLSACAPCEAASHVTETKLAVHSHAAGVGHDHDADHHAESAKTPEGNIPASPCERGHDDGDCACSKQSTYLTVAKPTLEFPTPIVVAVLSFPAITETWASLPSWTTERDSRAFARPPTSLLRLHCALIV